MLWEKSVQLLLHARDVLSFPNQPPGPKLSSPDGSLILQAVCCNLGCKLPWACPSRTLPQWIPMILSLDMASLFLALFFSDSGFVAV
jgi:hypothetical protein